MGWESFLPRYFTWVLHLGSYPAKVLLDPTSRLPLQLQLAHSRAAQLPDKLLMMTTGDHTASV